MIIPKLQTLISPDVMDLTEYKPEDPHFFGLLVETTIGDQSDDSGADLFGFIVCSPKWLANEIEREGYVWGRHYLFFNEYDYGTVRGVIEELCSSIQGQNWDMVAQKLARYGQWEFEDYRELPES